MSAHTPGPWFVECEPYLHVRSANHGCVFASDYTTEANRCLIAAAPDLLAALQGWMNHLDSDPDTDCEDFAGEDMLMATMRAAIAKATQP